ncbi:MAG: C39 family peptidase [Acidaminobacteraceae bacterium]
MKNLNKITLIILILSSFLVGSVFADLEDANGVENTKIDLVNKDGNLEIANKKIPINYKVANLTSDYYQIISAESGKQIGYKKGSFDIIDVNNQYIYINHDLEKYKLGTTYGDTLTAEWYKTHDIVKIAPDKNLYNQMWNIYEFEDGYYIRYSLSTQFLSLVDNKMVLSYKPHKFYINKRNSYNEKEFVRYAMDYPAWKYRKYSYKTMNYTGCGPTALAMVINYYSNQTVTPLTVADISVANNLDIIPNPRTDMAKLAPMISEKYKVNMKFIEKEDVMSELKNGNMVIIQTALNPLIKYTNGVGHYLVLKGIDKNGWIIVSDPLKGHSYHTKPDASIQDFDKIHTYIAPESDVLAKVRESYSFWKK